jgi:hypothetical protein
MAEHDTLLNAVLGAVATALLSSFVPFAPLFGGAISGYLEGGTRSDGLRVGAISGLIGLLLWVVVGAFFVFVFALVALGGRVPALFGAFGVFVILVGVVFGAIYTVGLSALGGWLGNYVKYDTNVDF